MNQPLQITWRNLDPSPAIEEEIGKQTEKLQTLHGRITSCRVAIEVPHQHGPQIYHVRIQLRVPGRELVVSHDPGVQPTHEDLVVAIHDAFDAVRRRLQEHRRRVKGQVKRHELLPEGEAVALFPDEDYGFLRTGDGRDVYFHRHAVVDGAFDRIEVGSRLSFVESVGDRGPQASTVHLR